MSVLLNYFLVLYLGMVKPGPGIAFFTLSTISEGFKYAFVMLLGCASSHALMVFLLFVGLDVSSLPKGTLDYIQLFALTCVVIYGIKCFLRKPKTLSNMFASAARSPTQVSLISYFIQGTIWPLTNPFNYIIYAAMLPSLLASQALLSFHAKIIVAFCSGLMVIVGVLPYMLTARKAIQFLKSPKVQRNLDKLTGAFCILIALGFLPKLIIKLVL